MSFYQKFLKRFFDIVFAILLSAILLVPFAIIAIAIKLSSKGPIFFTQIRTGLGGANFKLIKFRSMTHNNDVRDFTKENEYTVVGKIIRRLSLDEIPQIINVLRGEMSFIGPRPWIPEYYLHMTQSQRKRFDVLPGITGLAQSMGRNNLTIHEKIDYDLDYVSRISILEDIKIIYLTLVTVLKKSNLEISKFCIYHELDMLSKSNIDSFSFVSRD